MAISDNNRIYTDRRDAFIGRAKIKIVHLQYEDNQIHGTRPLDLSNIARIRQIYKLEGCEHLKPKHCVAALIDHDTLHRALNLSHL